ncbi:FAD-binding protein [Oxyplasma meridianum]|uniref:FAD-binding protein n=1 Tax=Oxyplasma meridianum TaxID=3073602 RepID=A0AAX4NIY4_9ARCH
MKILVLIKQIPDVNRITFDSKTMRIVREGVPLMFNSFDKKAVEEAIRIKEKIGSEVVVATMGPPSAGEILNESLRMGADTAYLVTDRSFAGSDTWATAKILSRVVEYVKPDLVLAGKYSLDGETSQVPPEVAFMTGMKFKSSVFRIEFSEDRKGIIIEQDREDGINRYEGNLPALLSVSEKINRARSIKPETPDMTSKIVVINAEKLGIDFNGTDASPTVVTGTSDVKSQRLVKFLAPGKETYEKILNLINERKSAKDTEIVDNSLHKKIGSVMGIALGDPEVSIEIASKALQITRGMDLEVIMAGNLDPEKLKEMPCNRYIKISAPGNDTFANRVIRIIDKEKPEFVIFPSTIDGREIAARIAAEKSLGLTADCIDLKYDGKQLIQLKPAFGGGIVAEIVSKTKPAMATVRPGMFLKYRGSERFKLENDVSSDNENFTLLENIPVPSEYRPLSSSSTVIGLGRGIKRKDFVQKALELSRKLGSTLGATRPIVDMGFVPRQQQIGLTGSSISSDVYINLGVSGHDNHIVGLRYVHTIVSVNVDPNAPIFKYSDYGIVCDLNEFTDGFLQYLEEKGI